MNATATHPRQRRSLDGDWQFRTDPDGALTPDAPGPWRSISVPAPWQSQSEDLRFYQGVAWYRRSFDVPSAWDGRAVVLRFGAVDYRAEVLVNGRPAGEHTGGYLPFELDVSALVRYGGENEVVVRVTDPSNDRARFPTPFDEIPHGKQSWYGPLSGIWQSVFVEARASLHTAGLKITPDARTGRVALEARLSGSAPAGAMLQLDVLAPSGERVVTTELDVSGDAARAELLVERPELWELDRPARYTLAATLRAGGEEDRLEARFGFRTVESRDGAIYLNGRPLMLRGALDQDYYPGTIATPPSYEYLLHQARLAKRMGLNCLRCHIKVADPRYLEAADEAGILVWAELPNWNRWTPEVGERGIETLLGAIERDWNHPSVAIWTVINESWGVDLVGNPEHRAWLKRAFETVKAAATGRLVVDNSACFVNFHLKSDIDDYHIYCAMPDERAQWSGYIAAFAGRAKWTYGTHAFDDPARRTRETAPDDYRWPLPGDPDAAPLPEVERSGEEPLILSEFGNWGLPSLVSLRADTGADPWWFETGDDWGGGIVYPHGVEQRFRRQGLDRIFGDYEGLAAATRRAELDALRYEIEDMRRHPSIGGYVITEFTDVHWECNGLLDMRRQPKMPLSALAELNADTVLIPDRTRGALWAGGSQTIAVSVSHWGAGALAGAELRWTVTGSVSGPLDEGRLAAPGPIAPRSTVALGEATVAAPAGASQTLTLRLELWAAATEHRIAAAEHRIAVFARPGGGLPTLDVAGDGELAGRLAKLGYRVGGGGSLIVARRWTPALRERLLAGERLLLLVDAESGLNAALGHGLGGLEAEARRGTPRQGSWASSFFWLRGDYPGDGVLDDAFARVMPQLVLTGFAEHDYPDSVLAGMFVGWLRMPAAAAGLRRVGRGAALVTTFRIAENLEDDPAAAWLLERLVRELATQ